ncbi:alpha/beta hydrolase [Bacillus spongiae]|uniref:Alpha/beta hydrolase n=1 Tax=Bacillus spongiae TaxID=2683610 RepID=A0ABU8HHI1_9BACI
MLCNVEMGRIYYEIYGEGFPVLLLHGMGTDHRSMKAWAEPIYENIKGFQRVYIDLPAHGKSTIDEGLKTTNDMLTNILEFIDKVLPNSRFLLIGSSFGGYLAQGILHSKREQVKGVCLLAPVLHLKERNLPEKVVLERDEGLNREWDDDCKNAFRTLFVHQSKINFDCFMNEIQPGRLLANKDFLASSWREKGYLLSEEPLNDVPSLPHHALIILGRHDSICGYKDHFFLLDKLPNSTVAILDGAGHMLQVENREIVRELVKDWLNKISINL